MLEVLLGLADGVLDLAGADRRTQATGSHRYARSSRRSSTSATASTVTRTAESSRRSLTAVMIGWASVRLLQ